MRGELFGGKHNKNIKGVLSCLDRVVVKGTFKKCCHQRAIEYEMFQRGIRFFDFPNWAKERKDEIRDHVKQLAEKEGLEIQHLRSRSIRKEDFVREQIKDIPEKEGVVCILSAMEGCASFRPHHDKETNKCSLKYQLSHCLHYYIYINDPQFGLCFIAFPTWLPFTIRFYFNGHNWLQKQLDENGIGYTMDDNCFTDIDDYEAAQELTNGFKIRSVLVKVLGKWSRYCLPTPIREFGMPYWTLHEVELATDIIFKDAESLSGLYEEVVHTAMIEVKAKNVATFLDRSFEQSECEASSRIKQCREGTSIRHNFGKAAIKMYDKRGRVLRVETVLNDVSFLKARRKVEHRDGTVTRKNAPVKKSIYSLNILQELMSQANNRYLTFIGGMTERSLELAVLRKLTSPVQDGAIGRTVRGINLFNSDDELLLQALLKGDNSLQGFTNRQLRFSYLKDWSAGKISRALKRFRRHGIIRKVGKSYRYHLTKLGRQIAAPLLKIKTRIIIPELSELT